ncbi:hypothetical protein CKO_04839 [Citrobacter koseri ATCC BAA-895]|uniref:Uncharacterized protein n=1 Tax=Citrobacter koseri (strain ATCC BAA-895 / CDC 4225-83 / SGSC4696) TaxID=290338 RepID=A8AQX1_CITK8|nr:hypothetical protein CKO_04839 [Citrobacter koseri ATCC BAA-895]
MPVNTSNYRTAYLRLHAVLRTMTQIIKSRRFIESEYVNAEIVSNLKYQTHSVISVPE